MFSGLMTTSEVMDTLERFPHAPVDADAKARPLSRTVWELRQAYKTKLLSKKVFSFGVAVVLAENRADMKGDMNMADEW